MAQQFLSINKGQGQQTGLVLTATSAPTADVYVQILSTNSLTKKDVILSLEAIIKYIVGNGVPGGAPGTNLPVL